MARKRHQPEEVVVESRKVQMMSRQDDWKAKRSSFHGDEGGWVSARRFSAARSLQRSERLSEPMSAFGT